MQAVSTAIMDELIRGVFICFHWVLWVGPAEKRQCQCCGIIYLRRVDFLTFSLIKQAASSSYHIYSEYTSTLNHETCIVRGILTFYRLYSLTIHLTPDHFGSPRCTSILEERCTLLWFRGGMLA